MLDSFFMSYSAGFLFRVENTTEMESWKRLAGFNLLAEERPQTSQDLQPHFKVSARLNTSKLVLNQNSQPVHSCINV